MINFKGDMIHEVIVDHDCFYSDRLANIDGPFLNDNERTMAINYTPKLKKRSRSLSFELERMSNMNIKDDFGIIKSNYKIDLVDLEKDPKKIKE